MLLRPLNAALTRHAFAGTSVLFLAFLAILLSGAVFLPVASGADEAAHYVYAAAVVRGQAGILEPTLPARLANIHQFATCIAFQPDVTAACQGAWQTSSGSDVQTQTNAGLYNPVFYAWTGIGTLLVPTEYGLYISRALAAIVTAGFFAWALSFLARTAKSAVPLAASALVLTPMTLYVGMVLNPSAWEISSLFATAVSGFAVAAGGRQRGWGERHSMLLIAGSLLIVSRGLSPLFLLITAAVVILAAGPRARLLLRDSRIWTIAGAFAATTGAGAVWVLIHGTNYVGVVKPATLADGIRGISVFYSDYHNQVGQMYGTLGWLDLPSPEILSTAWIFLLGMLIVTAFGFARKHQRLAIVVAFAAATIAPGLLAGLQWSGAGWQGRYTLPLVAAAVMVSALSIDRSVAAVGAREPMIRRWETAVRWVLPSFFVLGTGVVAVIAGHRYLAGMTAPFTAPWQWTPSVPPVLLAVAFAVGVLVVAISLCVRPRPD